MANDGGVKGSRQRYGMLLPALGATSFFEATRADASRPSRSVSTIQPVEPDLAVTLIGVPNLGRRRCID